MASSVDTISSTVAPCKDEPVVVESKKNGETTTVQKDNNEKEITWEELAKHNKPNDAWIGLYGSVYDVSKWGRSHPGKSSLSI